MQQSIAGVNLRNVFLLPNIKEAFILVGNAAAVKRAPESPEQCTPPGRTNWSHVPRAPALPDLLLLQNVVGRGVLVLSMHKCFKVPTSRPGPRAYAFALSEALACMLLTVPEHMGAMCDSHGRAC